MVSGRLSGNPKSDRAARKAKAWASNWSPAHPTCSAGSTGAARSRLSAAIKTGFLRPPPHTIQRATGAGKCPAALATAAAAKATRVAAPSAADSPSRGAREKASRSSDLGGALLK